jgi:hypothetical protein
MNAITATALKFVLARILGAKMTADLKNLLLKTINDLITAQFKVKYTDITVGGVLITAGDQRKAAVKKALAADKTELGKLVKTLPAGLINLVIESLLILKQK